MIMRDRLTDHNLESNPRGCYMFIEKAPVIKANTLFDQNGEEQDPELLKVPAAAAIYRQKDGSKFSRVLPNRQRAAFSERREINSTAFLCGRDLHFGPANGICGSLGQAPGNALAIMALFT